jgi:integrase
MPNYTREGKILTPISDLEFSKGIREGHFTQAKHKAFTVLLFYSAVRKAEALRTRKENFQITEEGIVFEVGKRLKHGLQTPPLFLPLKAPYMTLLKQAIEETKVKERVFPYSLKTGYNIVRRVWHYPHLFRLSRITSFFEEGKTIPQVRSWTGLSLRALEFYVGMVDIHKMGDSLAK